MALTDRVAVLEGQLKQTQAEVTEAIADRTRADQKLEKFADHFKKGATL